MKVTQEKLPASQIGLEIEIPPEMSKKAYEQVIQDLARTANIPGFRKGKVPRQILMQRFGTARLKAAALEDVIRDGVQQAVKQENINAIGEFYLNTSQEELVQNFNPGEALTISVKVDVPPEVKLNQYTGLDVKAEEVKYDPEQVDRFLAERQKENATLIPVEGRVAQKGDVAVVDFKGRIVSEEEGGEETPIPGGEAEDFQVELAEGRFIEGFVDGIEGMNPGETKEISVTFPQDYPQQDLAGKPAVFTITLKELKEKELRELNDDFAQEISEFQTLAELRESLEKRFQETAQSKTDANKTEAILKELQKQVEVDLPETLIQQEVDAMLTQTAIRLSNQGVDVKKLFTQDMVTQMRQASRGDAIDRLKRSLALKEVAKLESIQLEPAAIEAKIQELTKEFADDNIDPERLREFVEEDLLKDKIITWLTEHSNLELVPEGTLKASTTEATESATETIDTPEVTESTTEATSESTSSTAE
ncbi:trigger factor [Phormidium sp. LEGE 05292]|uniref:trigger factor n=1 Tax=[Phormidium] sp. LEGE 05292 TaxID=767427 RepID=UPI00187F9BEC|nr:trigger factor [Phormidium sp. LEGE 05292]MBE9226083.1 trigger factor [Phormidium sp. LEGE 05292]